MTCFTMHDTAKACGHLWPFFGAPVVFITLQIQPKHCQTSSPRVYMSALKTMTCAVLFSRAFVSTAVPNIQRRRISLQASCHWNASAKEETARGYEGAQLAAVQLLRAIEPSGYQECFRLKTSKRSAKCLSSLAPFIYTNSLANMLHSWKIQV